MPGTRSTEISAFGTPRAIVPRGPLEAVELLGEACNEISRGEKPHTGTVKACAQILHRASANLERKVDDLTREVETLREDGDLNSKQFFNWVNSQPEFEILRERYKEYRDAIESQYQADRSFEATGRHYG